MPPAAPSDATHVLEQELARQRALLRTVIDENPNIILLKDWNGKFLLGNRALAQLYGTTTDQLEGQDDSAFNPNAEQVAFYLANVQGIMRRFETEVVLESSTDSATGEVRYYQSIKKPLRDDQGNLQILVIANDITDIRQAQLRAEASCSTCCKPPAKACGTGTSTPAWCATTRAGPKSWGWTRAA